ncbi:MAG: zinc ribbon domain-containing protein [Prevotella sp.]|nr:zinc ribbon domain-containing protein [Prevotella sp.]
MEEKKKCPYCGEEILAIAKKCKHCGEWLDKGNSPTTPLSPTKANHSPKPDNIRNDLYKYGFIALGVIAAFALVYFIASNKGQHEASAPAETTISDSVDTINPASTLDVESAAKKLGLEKDGDDKLSEAILYIASDGKTVIATSDDKVYYLSNSDSDDVYDSEGANCGKIGIYDVNNRTTSFERIRTPSGEPYNINSYNFADDKITFVLVDAGRNGFGTGNFITNVSQYNIKTGKWKTIAEGCADAKFTDDRNYVIITTAEITNYDEAESALEYKYDYSTNRIKL